MSKGKDSDFLLGPTSLALPNAIAVGFAGHKGARASASGRFRPFLGVCGANFLATTVASTDID